MKTDTYNPFIDDEEEGFTTREKTLEESESEERDVLDDLLEDDDEDIEGASTTPSARPAPRFTKPHIVVPSPSQTVAHPSGSLSEDVDGHRVSDEEEHSDGFSTMFEDLLEDDDETVGQAETKRPRASKEEILARFNAKTPAERREMRRREKEAEAQGILLPGHKKRTKNLVWKRAKLTEKDLLLFEFLAKTRYATASQIASLFGVKDAKNRLCGLYEWQYHIRKAQFFEQNLWMLGQRGANAIVAAGRVAEDEYVLQRVEDINLIQVEHTLAIVEAMLMARDGRMKGMLSDGQMVSLPPVPLSAMMGETYIERLFVASIGGVRGATQAATASASVRAARKKALDGVIAWSEVADESGAVWIPIDPQTQRTHRPDFVINHEAKRKSDKPVSIAVEVELSLKKDAALDVIMRAYRADRQYRNLIYACGSGSVARRISAAARRNGLPEGKLVIVPLTTRGGVSYRPTWRLGSE
jgi:hypothetical protein